MSMINIMKRIPKSKKYVKNIKLLLKIKNSFKEKQ